jgi:hypothetical protein
MRGWEKGWTDRVGDGVGDKVGGWGGGMGWGMGRLIIWGAYNRNLTVSFYKFYYNL